MNYPRDYVACGGEPHDDMQPRDSAAEAAAHAQAQAERGPAPLPNPDHLISLGTGRGLKHGELSIIRANRSGGKTNFVRNMILEGLAGVDFANLEARALAYMAEDPQVTKIAGIPVIVNRAMPAGAYLVCSQADLDHAMALAQHTLGDFFTADKP